jgi:hypothetical protein
VSTPHAYAEAVELIHDSAPLIRLAREHHRSERGAPILFADKPYLPALLADLPRVREASFRKAVQTGISEALVMLILYESGWRGRICAYALPDNKIIGRFVTKRIDKVLADVPAYRSKLPFGTDPDRKAQIGNVAMKKFGSGTMLFLGAETPSNWVEFSTDTFVIDELDWCNAEHVAKAADRVHQSSSSITNVSVLNSTQFEGVSAPRKSMVPDPNFFMATLPIWAFLSGSVPNGSLDRYAGTSARTLSIRFVTKRPMILLSGSA